MSKIPPHAAVLIAELSREGEMRRSRSRQGRRPGVRMFARLVHRREVDPVAASAEPAMKAAPQSPPQGRPASV